MTDKHAAEAREKARQEKNVYKKRALVAEARNAALLDLARDMQAFLRVRDALSDNEWEDLTQRVEAAIAAAEKEE